MKWFVLLGLAACAVEPVDEESVVASESTVNPILDAYTIELSLGSGAPQQRSSLFDTWWELSTQMQMQQGKLVFPTGHCLARRIPLINGNCLVDRLPADSTITSIACFHEPDNSTKQFLPHDFIGIGPSFHCDRRVDDPDGWFELNDSCLHPHVAFANTPGVTFTEFTHETASNGWKVPEAREPFRFACEWQADPRVTFRNVTMAIRVEIYEPGTLARGRAPGYPGLSPAGVDHGQLLEGEVATQAFALENFGIQAFTLDQLVTSGPHASDVTIDVPRFRSPPSRSRFGHHAEPPPDVIGQYGRLAFTATTTAPRPDGTTHRIEVVAETSPMHDMGFHPRVPITHTPVARYAQELVAWGGMHFSTPIRIGATDRRQLTIRNRGGVGLTMRGIQITGRDAGAFRFVEVRDERGFVVTPTSGQWLLPRGATFRVSVEFANPLTSPPPAPAQFQAQLELTTDSIDNEYSRGGVSAHALEAYVW
jgi:hypothetical protein